MATIQANQGWQDSGVEINAQSNVVLSFLSGAWTSNPTAPAGPAMYGPDGNPNYIANQLGYVLRGSPEGCLCGRIVDDKTGASLYGPFFVGSYAVIPNSTPGRLQLVINDDLNAQWGKGLADNSGSIVMYVSGATKSPEDVLREAREHLKKSATAL